MLRRIFNTTKKLAVDTHINIEKDNLLEKKDNISNQTIKDIPQTRLSSSISIPETKIITSHSKEECNAVSNENHKHENELKDLCHLVESHKKPTNWTNSYKIIQDAKMRWNDLIQDSDDQSLRIRFDDACNVFFKKYDAHQKVREAIKEREQICAEIEKFIDTPKTEKINYIKEKISFWESLDKIPEHYDEILAKRFRELSENFEASIIKLEEQGIIRDKITPELEQICKKLEELVSGSDTEILSSEKAKLENRWIKLTDNLDIPINKYSERYQAALEKLETMLQHENESRNNEIKILESELKEICDKMKICSESDDIKSVLPEVKEMQTKWDAVTSGKIKDKYSYDYKKYYRKYFSRLKYLQQKEDWGRWENYTKKMLLCEKIEELLDEPDMFKVARKIKTIWNDWRKIGSVPKEENEIIWERFNSTRQVLQAKCKEFYLSQEEERNKNLVLKENLCKQAEELKNSQEWETTAKQLKNIQEEWKNIGRAPQPQNDELFNRLRKACDIFFQHRMDFYNGLHSVQAKNKEVKKKLCEDAKELVNMPADAALQKVKELRSQWKKTNSASRKDEQKLWKYFNTEIDNFFSSLTNEKKLNLEKKQKLCLELELMLNTVQNDSEPELSIYKNNIKKLKQQWHETGSVPRENEGDINRRFFEGLDMAVEKYYNACQEHQCKSQIESYERETLIDEISACVNTNSTVHEIETVLNKIKTKWNQLTCNYLEESELKLFQHRFEQICSALESRDNTFFAELDSRKLANLKSKKEILIQLEKLADINIDENDITEGIQNNILAEELKFALENNCSSNEKLSDKYCMEKYSNLMEKWRTSEIEIPLNEYNNLYNRYNNACSLLNIKLKKDI